ncbi:MAG: xanthine dehydrogenase family protein subunit M [Acidobacteria bacterium]|nr:xanthine dehydrogenase family protein subunit M [Acidobacteriota bacterium]
MISQIRVHSPRTLPNALEVLQERSGRARILAGGTDLMVYLNTRVYVPTEVINIWGLDELRHVRDEDDVLILGALVTYSQIIRSPVVARFCPILAEASKTIGAVQVQNRGTLGGNVANGSPAGDALPVLSAFDAEVELASTRGTRRVAFNQFYTGYRQSVMEADELLTAIRVPKQRPDERAAFYKVGTRRAQAISKVVMGVKVSLVEPATIETIQISLGSVAPTVIRASETEALLQGKALSPEVVDMARSRIMDEIQPISDIRSTEHYRRVVSGNLLERFLSSL